MKDLEHFSKDNALKDRERGRDTNCKPDLGYAHRDLAFISFPSH